MSREEVEGYLREYRASDDKTALRTHALCEHLKWKAIRDGIRIIETEEG
jgi:hypothetical protein